MPPRKDLAVLRFEKPAQRGQRVHSGSVELEHTLRDRRVVRIKLNRAQQLVVSVSQWWPARVDTLRSLFAHPLAHFVSEILDIVPCDDKLDSVDEFRL